MKCNKNSIFKFFKRYHNQIFDYANSKKKNYIITKNTKKYETTTAVSTKATEFRKKKFDGEYWIAQLNRSTDLRMDVVWGKKFNIDRTEITYD